MCNENESWMIDNPTSQTELVKTTEACSAERSGETWRGVSTEKPVRDGYMRLRSSGLGGNNENQECKNLKRFDLLLLHSEHANWDRIKQAISQQGWKYLSLSSFPASQDLFLSGVKGILIDAFFLPEISRQLRWLHAQEQPLPALFFVSDRYDIDIRIQALQAGARRLFSEPVDLTALIKTIGDFIHPKPEPSFRVLVIAEDESKSKPISELLHEGAMEPLVLIEPVAIIDTIWRFRPDLILMLDPRISDVDNIVLTKLIRDREESLAIPIVFLSEDNDPKKELLALQAGADDFISMSMQPRHVLNTIVCRIERVKTISTSGVQIIDEHSVELPDRKAMINQLEQIVSDQTERTWFHGVIIIALAPLYKEIIDGQKPNRDQLIPMLIEGLGPILQARDYSARIGNGRFAVLIRRSSKKQVTRQADLVMEITNYRLTTSMEFEKRFGVSLTMLKDGDLSADELLQRGEQAADVAYRQWRRGYTRYIETPKIAELGAKEGNVWLREEFIYALQSGSMNFQERRFISPKKGVTIAETVELIPKLDLQSAPVDIYLQATLCGATVDFDRFICEKGMRRLYEYTHEGKSVRLIVRQSADVVEESDYVEFIKTLLRKFHIVGNGLLLEFSLPSIVSRVQRTITFFDELAALGIGISLSHFPCNGAGYKALLHLKADVVRPRSSYLNRKADRVDIEYAARNIRSRHAEIILPYTEDIEQISPKWYEYADYIQAEIPREELRQVG